MSLLIRNANCHDINSCYAIEGASYGSEGATKERILHRINTYPEGFLVASFNGNIVGFINSCCIHKTSLSDESIKALSNHDPQGAYLVILSLAIDPNYRQQGHSRKLMQQFLLFADAQQKNVLLLCKHEHISMYQKYGFSLMGQSRCKHGGIDWFEMSYKNHQ